ncbi:unnamed protein product [marine sediment metagenome]|uniref:Uncharacterized protein n=1 Tax=marine sediment metagenome TaxID=412755 RepID=X1PT15_9ZZZZ
MRHSARTQTEHYTHFSRQFLKQNLEKYSPIRLINGELPKIAYVRQLAEASTGDVAQLLPRLLDQMEALGETAKELKLQLAGNGHKAELLQYITEELKHQVNK